MRQDELFKEGLKPFSRSRIACGSASEPTNLVVIFTERLMISTLSNFSLGLPQVRFKAENFIRILLAACFVATKLKAPPLHKVVATLVHPVGVNPFNSSWTLPEADLVIQLSSRSQDNHKLLLITFNGLVRCSSVSLPPPPGCSAFLTGVHKRQSNWALLSAFLPAPIFLVKLRLK